MEKIFEKGTSVHVGSYRFYVNDGKLYEDEDHEHQVTDKMALQAFAEGKLQIALSQDLLMASAIKLNGSAVSAGGSSYQTKTTA